MKLVISGLIVGIFGLAVCTLSTCLDNWYSLSNEKGITEVHFGLWRRCTSWVIIQKCTSWSLMKSSEGEEVPSWLQACQALMILANIFIAFGLISIALFVLQLKPGLYLKRISMAFCIASGVCAFIAVSLFGTKYQTESPKHLKIGTLDAGFQLAVCGAVLGLFTGLLIGSHKIDYSSL